MIDEIDRLEDIFSLHRLGSQLSRLNTDGRLTAPARDLREALAASAHWTKTTEGAFDPAIQPLWQYWARGVRPKPVLRWMASRRYAELCRCH